MFPGKVYSALDLFDEKSSLAGVTVATVAVFFMMSLLSTAVARQRLVRGIRALVSATWNTYSNKNVEPMFTLTKELRKLEQYCFRGKVQSTRAKKEIDRSA